MRLTAVHLPMLRSHPLNRIQSPDKLSTAYVTCSGRLMSPDAPPNGSTASSSAGSMHDASGNHPAATSNVGTTGSGSGLGPGLRSESLSLSTPSIESSRCRYSTVLQYRIVATYYDELLEVAGHSHTGVMCPLRTACGIVVVEPGCHLPWPSDESLQRFDFQLLSRTGLGSRCWEVKSPKPAPLALPREHALSVDLSDGRPSKHANDTMTSSVMMMWSGMVLATSADFCGGESVLCANKMYCTMTFV